jgi:hypothetical protein
MRNRITFLLGLATVLYGRGVVIDRIAVVVGKHAIKSSEIDRDLRAAGFLNREPLSLSPEAKRKAAERLIDQTVIRDEITNGRYAQAGQGEADTLLQHLRQDRFGGSDSRLQAELSKYGLTPDQLRTQLTWQLRVLRFIDQRFRPGILVTDEEVRAYFDQHASDLKRQYGQNSSFEALEPKIRESLEGERVNQSFITWLEQARKRNRIEYRQEAFQ